MATGNSGFMKFRLPTEDDAKREVANRPKVLPLDQRAYPYGTPDRLLTRRDINTNQPEPFTGPITADTSDANLMDLASRNCVSLAVPIEFCAYTLKLERCLRQLERKFGPQVSPYLALTELR